MANLLDQIVLPVASEDDAAASARALAEHDYGTVTVVHVVEKAGGAPDKAGVEQREEAAEEMFDAVRDVLGEVDTDVLYGTDVVETIFDAAAELDASAVVVTPRGGNRFVRLLTGDVALKMVTENDRPVVVLPDGERDESADATAQTESADETEAADE